MYKKIVLSLVIFGFSCNLSVNAQTVIPVNKALLLSEDKKSIEPGNSSDNNTINSSTNNMSQNNLGEGAISSSNKSKVNDYLILKDSLIGNELNKIDNSNFTESQTQSQNEYIDPDEGEMMTSEEILGASGITIDEFGTRIMSRILDVVGFLQNIAKPIAILFFILSSISTVIAVIFNGKNVGRGFVGMALSILMYVGIMYSPDLVMFFSTWLSTGV